MTNLEWCKLAEKFYSFKNEAEKYGFYKPELSGMENSLNDICPFEKSEDIDTKIKNLAERER
nr:MAG TPA: hypothetical protein [Caudoviricetes sp.]